MIDWVSVRQQHYVSDTIGKNVCIWLDPASGETISEGVGYLSHEGSFSTAVQIRSHRGLIEWSGNPSRWGRADNVYGFTSLRECFDRVINPHLEHYGLPPFESSQAIIDRRNGHMCGRLNERRSQREGQDVTTVAIGAQLTRVDITRNLSAGDRASALAYIRAASCAAYRGSRPKRAHDTSVSWGDARNTTIKNYLKGDEILAHRSSGGDNEYRRELAAWCNEVGIIRQEVGLGRQALRSLGLRDLGAWSDYAAFEVARERVDSMTIGCTTGLDRAFDSFVSAGYTQRQAATLSGIVSRWYMGDSVASGVSRATWYRYCADVRAVLGLDLRSAPDVSVLNTRVRSVELRPVEAPSWYRHAA